MVMMLMGWKRKFFSRERASKTCIPVCVCVCVCVWCLACVCVCVCVCFWKADPEQPLFSNLTPSLEADILPLWKGVMDSRTWHPKAWSSELERRAKVTVSPWIRILLGGGSFLWPHHSPDPHTENRSLKEGPFNSKPRATQWRLASLFIVWASCLS